MTDRNGNSNCLEGYECPQCHQAEEFMVEVTTFIHMSDEGSGDHGHLDWDGNSCMRCVACEYVDRSSKFEIEGE